MDALRENSRSATATAARQKLRSAFVVVQVSLALVLLVSAGLLMKSFLNVNAIPVGFDHRNLPTFMIQFPQGGNYLRETGGATPSGSMAIEMGPRINLVSEQIRERLAAIPGVQGATAAFPAPLIQGGRQYNFAIEGREEAATEAEKPNAQWSPVMSEYFKTLGVTVIRGRDLGTRDTAAGTPVAVINATAARKYWPNEDPIGKRIKVDFYNDPNREIVGIVNDIKQNIREKEPSAQIYVPYAQLPVLQEARTALGLQFLFFIVRAKGDLTPVIPAMRKAVADVDPTLAINNIRTVEDYASLQLLDQWIYVTLISVFGSIALLLAVVGIYGVMAHSVSQRTSEIGVRVALGASSADVLRLVLRRGLVLTVIGLFIGLGTSVFLTRVIRSVLWGVTPTDPLTFALALFGLSAIALLACYIPARKALKIDPLVALRYE